MKTTISNEFCTVRHHHELLEAAERFQESPNGQLLIMLLHHASINDDGDWYSYPSKKLLADYIGETDRNVLIRLNHLCKVGVITKRRTGRNNHYIFNAGAIMSPEREIVSLVSGVKVPRIVLAVLSDAKAKRAEIRKAHQGKAWKKGAASAANPGQTYPQNEENTFLSQPEKQGAECGKVFPTNKGLKITDQDQDLEQRGREAPQRPPLSKNSLAQDQGRPAPSHQPTPCSGPKPSRRAVEMRVEATRDAITQLTKLITATPKGSDHAQALAALQRERGNLERFYQEADRFGFTGIAPRPGELAGYQQAQRQAGAAMPATQ